MESPAILNLYYHILPHPAIHRIHKIKLLTFFDSLLQLGRNKFFKNIIQGLARRGRKEM